MSPAKQKIRLVGAFAALAVLALAASCRGFFVNPTLTGLTVGPSGLTLNVDQTYNMVATGTYDDGSQRTLKSGVVWSSDDASVDVDQTSGLVTGKEPGSATISAASGGCASCSGSTQVDVVLKNVSTITVTPGSQSTSVGGSAVFYTATASNGGTPIDITNSGAVWHIYDQSGTTLKDTDFTITFVDGSGEGFAPTSTATPQTYKIKVTYPGTNVIGHADLIIS